MEASTTNLRQLWVSVGYDGTYQETKRHKPVTNRFTAHVPVEIQEIVAPIALEVDEVPGSAGPIAFRWDGESFWRPLLDEVDAHRLSVDAFQEKATRRNKMRSVSLEWLDWPFPHKVTTRGYNTYHEVPFDEPMAEDWEHAVVPVDLDAMTTEAQEAAEDLRIIDGIVHMRTPEPCLALSVGLGIGIHPPLPGRNEANAWVRTDVPLFRADRYELVNAVSHAWRTNDLAPHMEQGLPESGCRVLIPEAFVQDDLALAAEHLFGPLLRQTQIGISSMQSIASIETWIELRRIADEHGAGDGTAFRRGMDTLRQLIDGDLTRVPEKSSYAETIETIIKVDAIRRRIIATDALLEEILGIAPPIEQLDHFQL